ncbi:hypothetical protein F4782DRAFT_528685 [Xylaria castorea]|nr:hypothetical protein F4782DRAFT_528685 [Xylaria castorea]
MTFTRQMLPSGGIRTLTIQRPETTFIETLTLGNSVGYSTDVPVTVAPDSKLSTPSSSHVGAILSGVAAIFVLLFVVWFCGHRTHSRRSGGSSRRSEPGSYSGSSSSNGSDNASGSSRNDDPGPAASDMAEEQWEQPAQSMPGMPHPVARQWAVPPGFMGPLPGMGPPGVVCMGMPAGRGGPPPMMGRGGGLPPMHGGPPPPIASIVGNGGPPPMPQ